MENQMNSSVNLYGKGKVNDSDPIFLDNEFATITLTAL